MPIISRRGNKAMKFGLLIEYLTWETFFLKNHTQNEVDKLVWIHYTLVNLNIKTFLWYLSKNFGINMLNHSEVWFIKFYIILITVHYNITQLKLHIFITVEQLIDSHLLFWPFIYLLIPTFFTNKLAAETLIWLVYCFLYLMQKY